MENRVSTALFLMQIRREMCNEDFKLNSGVALHHKNKRRKNFGLTNSSCK